ncbi:uncharacterized protein HMPREF1541_00298 [Cyphellophora europaea CBS 101466]|uniref:Nucleoporin Nup133/Nup155-like C-terminal domain-containing protein n=1 Tax=Cyphellophora europaea (strain CBS 101466) TaxID=1220924 RepID=W2SDX4_CYPE1|nr:uncharacterized protein HMPREF1541_00298 [Cyphellophora europaea CBS 101466]ETN46114.1 hypothetical protein HMPREF1541_00298 [Cyphellophora europaea CBS 101466]
MFSPEAAGHTHLLRSKRTRQAAGTEDSIKLPQAKRKRSALRRDTFEPLADASINELAGQAKSTAKPNGHADTSTSKPVALQPKELSYRGPKNERRADRERATTTLTNNDFYTVSELPSLPQQVRELDKHNKSYTCTFSIEHGYAIVVSHNEAIIWPYHSSAAIPSSRDVIAVPLSFLQTSESDPLPLAAFTARSATGEPGLLVVSARWGTVIYWDTLTSASTVMPTRTSGGVQGSIPSLGGETIHDLVSAEPSGFIISFSHGRLAHISLRDQLGRPAIGVQFLRKPPSSSLLGGIGGSVRNLVGWDRRKGIPIVKAGAATKGQRDIAVMTENAEFEAWDTNLGVGHTLTLHQNFLEDIKDAMKPYLPPEKAISQYDVKVLDFELARPSQEIARGDEPSTVPLLALVSLSAPSGTQFYIVELVVGAQENLIRVVHPISCYSTKLPKTEDWRPRLLVVKTTAFAIFETVVVLFSLSKIHESPSSQLLMERHALPAPFQDAIRLDGEKSYRFVGFSAEEEGTDASCLLAVSKKGLLRIQSHKNEAEIDVDDYASKISARTRIEQAIRYGTEKENPLDLNSPSSHSFTQGEVEVAALEISDDIVRSKWKYLPPSGPSISKHLSDRAKALNSLIHHVMKYYRNKLSGGVRDNLMWDAEKIAAAQAIWKTQEIIWRRYPQEDREMPHVEFSLRALHESRQEYPSEEKGQVDAVRHWMLNSVYKCDNLLVEIVDCINELPDFDITDPRIFGEFLLETVDIWCAAYSAVFKFRQDNASQYGFGDKAIKDGLFLESYHLDSGRPWTSNVQPNHYAWQLLDHVCNYLGEWYDYEAGSAKSAKKKMPVSSDGKVHDPPPRTLINELVAKLPKQCDIFNRVTSEEIIWAATEEGGRHSDRVERQAAIDAILAETQPRLSEAVQRISEFNMEGAIDIAERLADPQLLVTLTSDYLKRLNLEAMAHPETAQKNKKRIDDVQKHAETYYSTFGSQWAFANFSRKIENGELGSILTEAQDNDGEKQEYVTKFLHRATKQGQQIGKLAWINDVVGEQNFSHAERVLVRVADEEMDIYNKKTELSLAKLVSLAAAEENNNVRSMPVLDGIVTYDNKLQIVDIQQQITDHVKLVNGHAIDAKAAEDMAFQTFSTRIVAKYPGLKRLLKSAIAALLAEQPLSEEALVDFLTLADPVNYEEEPDNDPEVLGREFALALRVVDLSDLPNVHKIALRQIVWRRIAIRDDWTILNNSTGKGDAEVAETLHQTAIFQTLIYLGAEVANLFGSAGIAAVAARLNEQIVAPDVILADNAFPIVLQRRFEGVEKDKEAVRKDLEKEQEKLRKYVDTAQLELHFSGLVNDAREEIRQMIDAEGEATAEGLEGEGKD